LSLFEELKRRNVFRVGIGYLIIAWLLAQVAELFLSNFGAPDWVIKSVLVLLVIGFPLALFFAWAYEMTPEGLKREKEVDRAQSITSQTGRKLDRAIIAVLVLALGYFVYDKYSGMGMGSEPFSPSSSEQTVSDGNEKRDPTPIEKSIAVLPFVNMSSDAEQEYFSDGISEEILNALAKVHELKVAGRTSSFAFKGQNQDLRLIGETLGVNHILEGSVRKSGDKVRITAQLVKVNDGFHLWSETYDRELTDIFAIQDEIANAILVQLKAALLEEQSIVSTRADTLAYDFYLLANQKALDRNQQSLEQAAALLDRSIEADGNFPPALAQRAVTQLLLSDDNYGDIPLTTARDSAKQWIDRALALDPDSAEALAALGLYWSDALDRSERFNAIEPLEKALQINPNHTNASNWLQQAYAAQGQLRKASQMLEELIERDPLYRPAINNATLRYCIAGDIAKARILLERVRPFFPNDPMIANLEGGILAWEGHYGEALPLLKTAWQANPNNRTSRFEYAINLLSVVDYEEILSLNGNELRVAALSGSGKKEEALILAQQLAASGENTNDLVFFLGRNQRWDELIEFVDSRWPDLAAWQADHPGIFGVGSMPLALLTNAYAATGNQEVFQDALSRLKRNLDLQREQGADNAGLLESEAYYLALAGDHEKALDKLDEAISRGWLTTPRIADDLPVFHDLEGDPRFEALQQRMIANLNAERVKLDLAPVELDRTL